MHEQLRNQDWEWERGLALLGPYGHILLDEQTKIKIISVNDG